jgi:hypothetical protein
MTSPTHPTLDTALFTPHLQPGENLLWSASYSDKLRRAYRTRALIRRLLMAAAAAVVALVAGYRLYETLVTRSSQAELAAAAIIPLYVAFGLTAACLCIFLLLRLKPEPAHADHYAATNLRLLALDPAGQLADQIAGADIGGAVFDRREPPRVLHIYGREPDIAPFFIEDLPDLRLVRARIADIFPETAQ